MASPTGLRPGPWRGLLPGPEFTIGPYNALPAEIWVVSAVQKRQGISRSIKSETFVIAVRKFPAVVVVSKIRPIKIVTLVEFQRSKPKTETQLHGVFGRPTTRTKVFGPLILDIVSKQRKPFRGKVSLRKPAKAVVVVQVVARVPLLILLAHLGRKQSKAVFKFTKVFGRPTAKVTPKAARYIKFVAQQAMRRARYAPVRIVVGEAPRTFAPTPGVVTEHLYIIMLPHMGQLMNH